MKFYFYLYGQKTGKIEIFIKRKNSKSEIMVLKKYGNHGHKWNFAQLFLEIPPWDIYQVSFKEGSIYALGRRYTSLNEGGAWV
jgi:hypothetical protein